MDKNTQITTQEQIGIVMPAVTPKQFIEAYKEYEQLKKALTTKKDIQIIQGNEFLKKSFWRKIATAFNLSVEITEEHKEIIGENNIVYHFTQKATAPNGRFTYGTGSCDRMEKGRPNTIHNTRATAETRAFNRAVSNLVGGGDVSAEEIDQDTFQESQNEATREKTGKEGKCSSCGATGRWHKPDCPNKE